MPTLGYVGGMNELPALPVFFLATAAVGFPIVAGCALSTPRPTVNHPASPKVVLTNGPGLPSVNFPASPAAHPSPTPDTAATATPSATPTALSNSYLPGLG